jgi:hypothetical protein
MGEAQFTLGRLLLYVTGASALCAILRNPVALMLIAFWFCAGKLIGYRVGKDFGPKAGRTSALLLMALGLLQAAAAIAGKFRMTIVR